MTQLCIIQIVKNYLNKTATQLNKIVLDVVFLRCVCPDIAASLCFLINYCRVFLVIEINLNDTSTTNWKHIELCLDKLQNTDAIFFWEPHG